MYEAHTVRDQVALSFNLPRLRKGAFTVIDRVQSLTPGEQLLGSGLAVVAMAEACGIEPHELIERAKNAMAEAEGPFTSQLQAIRAYAQNEIGRVQK